MSEAILLQNTVNKPGTSCLGCRRRKLKCSREPEGCFNCTKSDLPCVYPQPDVGVKRKRGPYKKDKPPRQRHLEDLVKYLEPKAGSYESQAQADSASPDQASSSGHSGFGQATPLPTTNGRSTQQPADQQSLVTDALVALTRSAAKDEDLKKDDGGFGMNQNAASGPYYTHSNPHPPARRIFEYWQLFVTRVDPMVKIIHCPTFSKKILAVIDDPTNMPSQTNAMMFSIYYAALSTCSAQETRERFGEGQEILIARYGKCIKDAMRANYELPQLEGLQALVLYIVCIRRSDNVSGIGDLFHEAVRCAQLIKLEEDPEGRYPPFEVEYRRRLWFHLCGLESRTAEEGGSRKYTILKGRSVQMPCNLSDCDLNPRMTTTPKSRHGVTDSTFPILRFEIHGLVFGIWNIRSNSTADTPGVTEAQQRFYDERKENLDVSYMNYMDESRPYDWLCKNFVEGMLTKARLIINFHTGTVPTKTMPEVERMTLLESSVDIIKRTHALAIDDRISDWVWYFRGYVQWHSLAIVVAELGWSKDAQFVTMAWNVLDDILAEWDTLYRTKKDDPAWTHVNDSIQRARKLRQRQKLGLTSQHKKARHSAPHDYMPVSGPPTGLTNSVADMRQPLQHRPAPGSLMPHQQPVQYMQSLSPYNDGRTASYSGPYNDPQYNNETQHYNHDGQTPQSHTSGGSDGVSPMSNEWNFDADPFPTVNWDAYNHVFTNDVWDTWEHMQDANMGFDVQHENWQHMVPDYGQQNIQHMNVMPGYGGPQQQQQYG